jgi:hypothetical protein
LLVLPGAVALASGGAPLSLCALGGGAAVLVAITVREVRRVVRPDGDVSRSLERPRALALAGLAMTLVLAALLGARAPWATLKAFAAGTTILLVALVVRGRWRASLHVAYDSFAAMLLAPVAATACAAGLALAAAVAWSRLALDRNTRGELAVGALLGLAAGVVAILR